MTDSTTDNETERKPDDAPADDGQRPPIESATASTACQTNDSRFPYVLAGSALLAAFLVLAIAIVVVFGFVSSYYNGSATALSGDADGYSYDFGDSTGSAALSDGGGYGLEGWHVAL